MARPAAPPSLVVLDAALTWTHGALQHARLADTAAPTPCAGWDLRALLVHLDDSLSSLGEAAALGFVDLEPPRTHATAEVLVEQVCRRARHTRAAWAARVTSAPIAVGDLGLGRDTLALVGAVEVLVHGWDVARSVGAPGELPADLVVRLLPAARALVGPEDRAHRFAAPRLPGSQRPADRLVAHLGRDPAWAPAAPARSA